MAERVGLSPSACLERTRRLERGGVIVGYRAVLDHAAMGAPFEVWGEVRLAEHSPVAVARFSDLLHRTPAIVSAYRVAGRQDFLLHVLASSMSIWDGLVQGASDAGIGIAAAKASVVVECVKSAPIPFTSPSSPRFVENAK